MAVVTGDTFRVPIDAKDNASPAFSRMSKSAEKLVGSVKQIGIAMAVANQAFELVGKASRVAGRAFDATVGKAIDLEKQVAEITTLLGGEASAAQAQFTDEVLKLQETFGGNQADIAKAFYQALSSGAVDSSNATQLLTIANKLAVGGVTTLTTAVDGLTNLMNAYGVEADGALGISDTLFIGMRAGKTTIEELSNSLGKAASLASNAGVGLNELVAATSAITTGGVTTSEAVTQVRGALVSLQRQSDPMIEALDQLGITSIQAALAQDGLVGTLNKIISTTDGSAESIQALFSDVEAVNAVTALTSDTIGTKFNTILGDMAAAAENAGQATDEAFQKISETTSFRLDVLAGRFDATMTRLGQAISTTLLPVLESLENAFDFVVNATSSLIVAFEAIPFAMIAEESQVFLGALTAIAAPTIASAVTALGAAFLGMAAPVILVAAKIALITAAVVAVGLAVDFLFRNWETLFDLMGIKAEQIANDTSMFFSEMKLTTLEAVEEILDGFSNIPGLGGVMESALGSVREAANETRDEIVKMDEDANQLALTMEKKIGELDPGLLKTVWDAGSAAVEKFTGAMKGAEAQSKKTEDAAVAAALAAGEAGEAAAKKIVGADPGGAGQIGGATTGGGKATRKEIEEAGKAAEAAFAKINKETSKIATENAAAGKSQRDLIEDELAARLQSTRDFENAMKLAGKEISDDQKERIKEFTEASKEAAERQLKQQGLGQGDPFAGGFVEAAGDATQAFAGQLTSAMMPLTGLMDAAMGIVGTAQKVVDFLPQFLDAVTNLINSVTELPLKIAESFSKLLTSITGLITNLLPNLFKAVGDILMDAAMFLAEGLPNAVLGMVDAIPGLIAEFALRLGEIIPKLVEGLARTFLLLPVQLAAKLVTLGPKIALALIEAIPEMVDEMASGLSNAGKEMANEITAALGLGEFFEVDTSAAEEKIAELGETLSRSTSNVFAVVDLEASARGLDVADRIRDAIASSTTQTKNILQRLWDALVGIWEWVRDKVLMPIWKVLENIWNFVWKNILEPFLGLLESVWNHVMSILSPLFDGLVGIFDGIWSVAQTVFTTIVELFKGAWNAAKTVFNVVVNLFKQAWNGLKIVVNVVVDLFMNVWNVLKSVWQTLMDLFSGKINLFEAVGEIFEAVFDGIINGFDILWQGVKDIFDNIMGAFDIVWQGAKEIFDGIVSSLEVAWTSIQNIFNTITTTLNTWKDALMNAFNNAFEPIRTFFEDTLDLSIPEFSFPDLPTFDFPDFPDFSFPDFPSLPKLTAPDLSIPRPAWLDSLLDKFSDGGFVVNAGKKVGAKAADAYKKSPAGKVTTAVGKGIESIFAAQGGMALPDGGLWRNGTVYLQDGGAAPSIGTDTVNSKLTPGEFVVNRTAARANLGLLSFINEVNAPVSPVQSPTTISVVINAKTSLDAATFKREVMPAIEKELKRKSQEGKFILASSGVRSNR